MDVNVPEGVDADQMQEAVEQFRSAVENGDAAAYCDVLSDEAAHHIGTGGGLIGPGRAFGEPPDPEEECLDYTRDVFDDEDTVTLPPVTRIGSGEDGSALAILGEPQGPFVNYPEGGMQFPMVLVDGEWKVAKDDSFEMHDPITYLTTHRIEPD